MLEAEPDKISMFTSIWAASIEKYFYATHYFLKLPNPVLLCRQNCTQSTLHRSLMTAFPTRKANGACTYALNHVHAFQNIILNLRGFGGGKKFNADLIKWNHW